MGTDSRRTNGSHAVLTAQEPPPHSPDRELFDPSDNVAILVPNLSTGHTVQVIAKAEAVANPDFQRWLSHQSASGYDVYVGMNPLRDGACSRRKDDIKDIRHLYLDLDKNGDQSLQTIRDSREVPAPNFVLDTSPGKHQVVRKVSGLAISNSRSYGFPAQKTGQESCCNHRSDVHTFHV